MNISVDAIIISLTARCLKAFTPADFPSTISIRIYKLLKSNNHLRGRPKRPVEYSTAAWVCNQVTVFAAEAAEVLVEDVGIEPTTPCLQSRCSPS